MMRLGAPCGRGALLVPYAASSSILFLRPFWPEVSGSPLPSPHPSVPVATEGSMVVSGFLPDGIGAGPVALVAGSTVLGSASGVFGCWSNGLLLVMLNDDAVDLAPVG